VTLMHNGTSVGTFTLLSTSGGKATFAVTFTSAGTEDITAVYAGDPDFAGGTSAVLVEKVN